MPPLSLQISVSQEFWPSARKLSNDEYRQVQKAFVQLSEDATHDGLRFKPIEGDKTRRIYTCRANQDVRLLCFRFGDALVLDRAGHHDDIYNLARRVDIVHNAGTGVVKVIEREVAAAEQPIGVAPSAAKPIEPKARPFDHWADKDFWEAGLGDDEIAVLRECATDEDVLSLDVDYDIVSFYLDLLGQTPEQWRKPSLDRESEAEERLRVAVVERGALAGVSPFFTPEEVTKLAAAPIEDWMIFLHPDQRAIVGRKFEGPARVRGSAGTGKTVVALHRAAALVRRFEQDDDGGKVLFTTFINSLPPVFDQLYRRLPSSKPGDDIEFTNIDKLAFRICREAGRSQFIDIKRVDSAFASAFKAVVKDGTPIERARLTRDYIRDEIRFVIKGRGVDSLDSYLEVERTGRRTRFGEPLRRQVWDVHTEWTSRMRENRTVDFPDVVLEALDIALAMPHPPYRTAIVDEAQDLSLVGLQLVRALSTSRQSPRADEFLIVGDGAQKIYAGGFTLKQAGVEVRGRTTVLRVNYRNTQQIIDAAMAVAGTQSVDDLGEEFARGEAEHDAARIGFRPVLVGCGGTDDEIRFVAQEIESLMESGTLSIGDFAVALSNNAQASAWLKKLRDTNLPVMELSDYEGQPVNAVKVGTHFRIKGLEFKVVFLPSLGDGEFPRKPPAGASDEEIDEQRSLAISQLFVAMTRARDGLFLLASGDPSPVLEPALEKFEVIDS